MFLVIFKMFWPSLYSYAASVNSFIFHFRRPIASSCGTVYSIVRISENPVISNTSMIVSFTCRITIVP